MKNLIYVCLMFLCFGCSVKQAAYSGLGAVAGSGIGYSYHHDDKEAVIGGLVGTAVGATIGEIEQRSDKRHEKEGYEQGFKDAHLQIALDNWNTNTGNRSHSVQTTKKFMTIKVPKEEKDGVQYESHYVTVEDYQ